MSQSKVFDVYPWPKFVGWFQQAWEPGEHLALMGPTGTGKSNFAGNVLPLRKWVMALDPKGGDSTLAKLGWPRVDTWPPPPKIRNAIAEGKPVRLVVGPTVRRIEDRQTLIDVQRHALKSAFEEGGWTVYIDEFQLAADRRMMGLHMESETLLIAARDRGVSVVTAFQAPSWVPTAASRQATWLVLWPTRDDAVVKRLAEIAGRPRSEIAAIFDGLDRYFVAVVGRDPSAPVVITRPPRL